MKNLLNKTKTSLYGLFGLLITTPVFAEDSKSIATQLDSLNTEVSSFGNLMMYVIGLAGIVLLFLGIMGLKKYADDARSNPLMKPMIYLVAGGALTGFTAVKKMFSTSLTGTETDAKSGSDKFEAKDS